MGHSGTDSFWEVARFQHSMKRIECGAPHGQNVGALPHAVTSMVI